MSKLITFAAVAACAAFAAMADKKQFSALDGEAVKRVKTHNLDGSPVVCECVATVEGREASLLPKGRQFKLVWNDEFEGDRLDDSKWGWRTNFWGHASKISNNVAYLYSYSYLKYFCIKLSNKSCASSNAF